MGIVNATAELVASLRTHRLDIVPIGIDQERREISRAVILAMTRRAIVTTAGLQAFGVKPLDRGMVGRAEGDVGAVSGFVFVQMQPECGLALRPKARAIVVARTQHVTER